MGGDLLLNHLDFKLFSLYQRESVLGSALTALKATQSLRTVLLEGCGKH